MAYDQMPKFVMAENLAMGEGENCTYGPTMVSIEYPTQNSTSFMTLIYCYYAIISSLNVLAPLGRSTLK